MASPTRTPMTTFTCSVPPDRATGLVGHMFFALDTLSGQAPSRYTPLPLRQNHLPLSLPAYPFVRADILM